MRYDLEWKANQDKKYGKNNRLAPPLISDGVIYLCKHEYDVE